MCRNALLVVAEVVLIIVAFMVAGLVASAIAAAIILLVASLWLFQLTNSLARELEKRREKEGS